MDNQVLELLAKKISELQTNLTNKILDYASSIEPISKDNFETVYGEVLAEKKTDIFRNTGQLLTLLEEIPEIIEIMKGKSKEENLKFLEKIDFEDLMYELTPRVTPLFVATETLAEYEKHKEKILQNIDNFFRKTSEEIHRRVEEGSTVVEGTVH